MPTLKQKEVVSTLNQFYQRPVAMVSLELILSIGLVIFLGVFAIQPTLVTMSDLIKERKEKIELQEQLQKKVAALQTAQEFYNQIQPQVYLLDQAIPKQPKLIQVLKIVEKLATENGVIISSIQTKKTPDEAAVTNDPKITIEQLSLPVTIAITGDYLSIRAFVSDLRESRRSMVIKSVSFALQEDRGNKSLQANITIDTPYLGVKTK